MIDALLSLGLLGTVLSAGAFFWTKEPKYGFGAALLLALVPLLHLISWLITPSLPSELAGRQAMRAAATSVTILFDLFCLAAAAALYHLARRQRDRQ